MISLRKRYLINPRFQLKYALLFFGIGVAVAAVVGVAAFFAFRSTYQSFLNANYYQPPELVLSLERQLQSLTLIMAGLLAALALVCLVLGIYMTHRVIGPLHRMRKTMDEIAGGDAGARLKFREGDEFQDLAESFNRMLERLTSGAAR